LAVEAVSEQTDALLEALNELRRGVDAVWKKPSIYHAALYRGERAATALADHLAEIEAAGERLAAAALGLVGAAEGPMYGKTLTATPTYAACISEAEEAAVAFRALAAAQTEEKAVSEQTDALRMARHILANCECRHASQAWESYKELDALAARLAEYKATLLWFADEANYDADGPDHDSLVQAEGLERAHAALPTARTEGKT
jgi:hypothetical protein